MQAARLEGAPTVDGNVLDDPQWRRLRPTSGFWQIQPDEGRPATQRTEVFVGFTDEMLYIGVVCYDDNPDGIIVSDSRRDAPLDETDSFQVIIDSFLDRQNGFVFGTNPAGIEYDAQVTKEGAQQSGSRGTSGFNLNWDTSWAVSAEISDIGWSAEMAIPFKSLRYGSADVQNWGINFQRNIRRNNEIAFWSPLPLQYNLYRTSQAGRLDGISVPPQKNLKITPYALSRVERGGDLPSGTHRDEEFGIDLKYSITPSLTLDATYNTDFAQVEVDDVVVNLDRFSVFLPEKRPFFLENAGQFQVGTPREVELFFSRKIGISDDGGQIPIEAGVRLSGKIGDRSNVGFLQMRSERVSGEAPRNDYTVARLNQEFDNRSALGALIVSREGDGSYLVDDRDDHNRTYAIDARLGIGEDGLISGYIAKTDTPDRDGKDHSLLLQGQYNSVAWSNNVAYSEVGEDFNPEVGFLSRTDYRKFSFRSQRRFRPDNFWGLHELRPHVSYRGFWDFDGNYETGFLHIDNHWEWRSGMQISTGVNFTHEDVRTAFEIIDGVFVPIGEYDNKELQLAFKSDQGAPLSLDVSMRVGGFFSGDRLSLEPKIRYRFSENFNTEFSWNYNDIDLDTLDGDFEVNVGRLRISYSFTPKIALEALIQYDDRGDSVASNIRFSWLQSANAGLYLVYNELSSDEDFPGDDTRREFIIKYSRIIDVLN